MARHHLLLSVTLAVVLCLSVVPTSAEEVIEAWRSPFGRARAVAVNPSDSSCWLATTTTIWHVAAGGTILSHTDEITASSWGSNSLAVNPTDGSCWVAVGEGDNGWVVHVAEDGTELWRGGGSKQHSSKRSWAIIRGFAWESPGGGG
jgi:hypothetical protein